MQMSMTDSTQRRARRQLVGVAALLAAVLVVGVLAAVHLLGQPGARRSEPRATTASAAPVVWRDVAGVRLPVSVVHGPLVTGQGQAAGYSRTRQGAALAAVQVLARTSASAGPDVYRPVLGSQVTGADREALWVRLDQQYRQLSQRYGVTVQDGAPLPGNDATVAGYRVEEYQGDRAVVDVVLTAPDLAAGQVVAFDVDLKWREGDWRVTAPKDGDWGAVARTLDRAPAGLLDYGQVG